MRRTDRLFEILQLFREGKTLLGKDIAEQLEVSLRTVYRDIETLIASGIPIEGERGVGYILREPIFLPPLALTLEELRALHISAEILRQTSDAELSRAAGRLVEKVNAVVPARIQHQGAMKQVSVYASEFMPPSPQLPFIRKAIENRDVLDIAYLSLKNEKTERRVWPLQTEFWGRVWTCATWCELREDFRVFRVDRIEGCKTVGWTYPDQPGRRYRDYIASMNLEDWSPVT